MTAKPKKVFILDTNVLLNSPLAIYKFDEHDVVIPITVIEEIDRFKKDQSDIGRNAREVSRLLDKLRTEGTLSMGIKLFKDREDSGQLFVYLGQKMDVLPELLANNTDNHILAIGMNLQKQFGPNRKIVVITNDSNLRIKADAFGIAAEEFEADKVDIEKLYEGIKVVQVDSDVINKFYMEREIRLEDCGLHPNEFVLLKDRSDSSQGVYGIYDASIDIVNIIDPRTEGVWGIYPRNLEQNFALEILLNDKIKLVTITGKAGTGKTLLAIASGLLKTTDEDVYQKLLVSRPIFPLGKDIGFLPGDIDDKLNPWMQPIFDNLEYLMGGSTVPRQKRINKGYQELINQGMLAVEPLTYIRGRSIPNQYFVVDEAQNLTRHEIKTIVTRAGEGTKIIFTGDPYQIDHPYIDSHNNGLTYIIEKFKDHEIAAHITLAKGERSELASIGAQIL